MAENPVTPCKLWEGANNHGYGVRRIAGQDYYVHRLAWEDVHGPLEEGWDVHHLCGQPSCYEEEHLVALPRADHHALHGAKGAAVINASKTVCAWGHEFTPLNTYTHSGQRKCKTCRARVAREVRQRKKEALV